MGRVGVQFDVALTAAIHKHERQITRAESSVQHSEWSDALGTSVVRAAGVAIADSTQNLAVGSLEVAGARITTHVLTASQTI